MDDSALRLVGDLIGGGGWAGLAAVLVWYQLTRARAQDAKIEGQAAEIGVLRTQVDELQKVKLTLLKQRLEDSQRAEERLADAIQKVVDQAERLGEIVQHLDETIQGRPCQLPERIQRKIRQLLREDDAGEKV